MQDNIGLGFDAFGMRDLIKMMETSNANDASINEELEKLIDLRYEADALLTPTQLNENWLSDKFKNISARVKAAAKAFKQDPNAPEVRELADDIISLNDAIVNSFSSVPASKIRVVYFSDNYEDIKRVYTSGLAAGDIAKIKMSAKKYAEAGNKRVRYSEDHQFMIFESGSKFSKVDVYSGAPSFLGATTFAYAVAFNAPQSIWTVAAEKMGESIAQFKPSTSNDNAVGILSFKKGNSFKKAILYPVISKEVLQKEYGDQLPDGLSFETNPQGVPVIVSSSADTTADTPAASDKAKEVATDTTKTTAETAAKPAATKLEITDYKSAAAAIKKLRKDVVDGKIEINSKAVKDIEVLKTEIDKLITVAQSMLSTNITPADWTSLTNAVKGDLTDSKTLSKIKNLYNKKVKHYVDHWAKAGGSSTKSDMLKIRKAMDDILVKGKTTPVDKATTDVLDNMDTDLDKYDTSK